MTKYYFALFVAIGANVIANLAFKFAMQSTSLSMERRSLIELLVNPWIWVGFLNAAILLGCYLYAIRGIEISIAYPTVTGIAMIGLAFFGAWLFAESLTLPKIIGIGLVIFGIFLITQDA